MDNSRAKEKGKAVGIAERPIISKEIALNRREKEPVKEKECITQRASGRAEKE